MYMELFLLAVQQHIRDPDIFRINVNKLDSTVLGWIPCEQLILPILQ